MTAGGPAGAPTQAQALVIINVKVVPRRRHVVLYCAASNFFFSSARIAGDITSEASDAEGAMVTSTGRIAQPVLLVVILFSVVIFQDAGTCNTVPPHTGHVDKHTVPLRISIVALCDSLPNDGARFSCVSFTQSHANGTYSTLVLSAPGRDEAFIIVDYAWKYAPY